MAKTVSIPVPDGLTVHGEILKAVTLREPSFDEFLEFGDPVVWTKAPDGSVFAVENVGVIKSYLAACLVAPKDPILLEQGGFRLARAVKDAILDFFRDAPTEGAPSSTSPTNSSSTAGLQPTPSVP